MLKKRFIGVITVKNGWAVQSFGYNRYQPLGKPECLVENLDRWGVDEILVQVIDRSLADEGPDFELLEKLAYLGLGTPLIYGGGIRTIKEGVQVIQSGADRLCIDALLQNDISVVKDLRKRLGRQAIIASIPMSIGSDGLESFNYRTKVLSPFSGELLEAIEQGLVSEVLLTDWKNEGRPVGFDSNLVDLFSCKKSKLIVFGGISSVEQMRHCFGRPDVVAVAVGNFLNYREHAIQQFKRELANAILRPSTYNKSIY
jgi:imidazole glycerol-phosphate synthase subunit HisF